MKSVLGGTSVLVDLVAMSPVLAKHRHFGCTLVVSSSYSVDLLGSGGGVTYWLRLNGCPMWIDVHCMRVWLSPLARRFFRTLLTFSLVDAVSPQVAEGGILCCAMVGIPSTLVLLTVVPKN